MGEVLQVDDRVCTRCNGTGKYISTLDGREILCYKCKGTGKKQKHRFDKKSHGKLLSVFGNIARQAIVLRKNQKEILNRLKMCEARDTQIKRLLTMILFMSSNYRNCYGRHGATGKFKGIKFAHVSKWMEDLISSKTWKDLMWIEQTRTKELAEVDELIASSEDSDKTIDLLKEIIEKNTNSEVDENEQV